MNFIARIKARNYVIALTAALGLVCYYGTRNVIAAEVQAASTTQSAAQENCQLNDAVDKLLSVKDSDLGENERAIVELEARKNVLNEITICSDNEISLFKDKLNGLPLGDGDKEDAALRDKFSDNLDTANDYYSNIKDKLTADLSLSDIKKLAEEVSTWRDGQYIPEISKINNFILVINSNESIKTAKARLQKITFTLNAVNLAKTKSISQLLRDSDSYLKRGEELNLKAHKIILTLDTASTSASSTILENSSSSAPLSTEKKAKRASSTPAVVYSNDDALALVKESLGQVKKAYANYLTISQIVKRVLGL